MIDRNLHVAFSKLLYLKANEKMREREKESEKVFVVPISLNITKENTLKTFANNFSLPDTFLYFFKHTI